MTQDLTIEVQRREETGKSANRRLRREAMIPAVVYGGGKEPIAIQVPRKTLIDLFKSGGSENRIFLLKLADTGQSRHAMITRHAGRPDHPAGRARRLHAHRHGQADPGAGARRRSRASPTACGPKAACSTS